MEWRFWRWKHSNSISMTKLPMTWPPKPSSECARVSRGKKLNWIVAGISGTCRC